MQQGAVCPNCQRPLRFIPQYQNWYCDSCGHYPFPQQMPMMYYAPPKSDSTKIILIVVLVLVILFVVVPIIFVAVFLTSVPDMGPPIETAPTAALSFTENTAGNYTGGIISLSSHVDVDEVYLVIIDISSGETATLDPLGDHGTAQVFNGISCTFTDSNQNRGLDAGDVFVIQNGASGDIIKLIHNTGRSIVEYTLS